MANHRSNSVRGDPTISSNSAETGDVLQRDLIAPGKLVSGPHDDAAFTLGEGLLDEIRVLVRLA